MRSAIVVGGGLAGIVVARELALRGWRIILLERSGRLGGKAGADLRNGRMVEHGYHVFPSWYPNVRAILNRIGVKLIDFERYHFLLPGEYPRTVEVRGFSNLRAIWHDIFHGVLPWYHNVLYSYSVLDMISRPLSEKSALDRVSQIGLIRGKWYTSESVAEYGQENVLKASAIPVYELSAMTAKKVSGYWTRQSSPFLSVLPGDLQTRFVEPQVRELQSLGVDIRYRSEVARVVARDGRVAGVALRDGSELTADVYALCTPFEVTRTWLDDSLYQADPELGNLHFLQAEPMAALHLRLRHRLSELPREHVFLHGGRYALSMIEVGELWNSPASACELSFISSNFGPLTTLSAERAKDLLLEEIAEYLPISADDVESWELNTNVDVPLFINTIGAWPNRPRPKSKARNLYIAGDYVRNEIDLACMEGAVSASLEAARHILRDHGEPGPFAAAEVPPVWPRPLLVLARLLLIPIVAAARAIAWAEENVARRGQTPPKLDNTGPRRQSPLPAAAETVPPRSPPDVSVGGCAPAPGTRTEPGIASPAP